MKEVTARAIIIILMLLAITVIALLQQRGERRPANGAGCHAQLFFKK
jgi:hypothetical protein